MAEVRQTENLQESHEAVNEENADKKQTNPKESPDKAKGQHKENGADSKDSTVPAGSKKIKVEKKVAEVLKSLSNLPTVEEKLTALSKKYTELAEENRTLLQKQKLSLKKLTTVTKEKEQAQAEHGKAVLAKGQLEGLCRELQRRCKVAKEETLHEVRAEEEKRKKIVDTFQTTINEIQGQINGHQETNVKLRDENIKLATQLKNLITQYEEREKHIEEILKHRELEKQLSDAKNAQILLQLTQEQDSKRKILEELENNLKRIALMEEHEKQLKAQIKMYTEKYEEFQGTLTNSNEVLKRFKSDMDAMTKRMRKMEKDANTWKMRWENSNKTLIQMAEEKTRQDQEADASKSKIAKLESLCRALQAERNKLAKQNESSEEKEAKTGGPHNTTEAVNEEQQNKDNEKKTGNENKEIVDETKENSCENDEKKETTDKVGENKES